MSTKAKALAAAKRKYGKHATVRHNHKAPDAAEREAILREGEQRRYRVKELDNLLRAIPDPRKRLLAAARFVADVNGDAPSIPQLKELMAEIDSYQALLDERAELREAGEKASGRLCRRKCEVVTKASDRFFTVTSTKESADTWQELIDKIEGKQPDNP